MILGSGGGVFKKNVKYKIMINYVGILFDKGF